MKIRTLPVYSKLADENFIPSELRAKLPEGLTLSQHQVETYRALTEGDAEAVFNTAMTGDGKSLAAQLPLLVQGEGWKYPLLAMYPTNELIEDQLANLDSTLQCWQVDARYARLNSATLDLKMQDDDYARRGEALMSMLRNHDVILTNPDIFHYVMHQFYTWPEDAPDRYVGPLTQKFCQLTFDEFHIFDAPQIVSVLNAILFMQETAGTVRPHKFLFLSATPKALMQKYLQRSGLKVIFVQGQYASCDDGRGRRKILNPVEISFEPQPRAEAWLEAHLDDIVLPFFLQRRPHAKGAIIVHSRAARSALEKIKLATRSDIETSPAQINASFVLEPASVTDYSELEDVFNLLQRAWRMLRTVEIEYESKSDPPGTPRKRLVDVYGAFSQGPKWYMVGYCHHFREVRTFKMKRIRSVILTDRSYRLPDWFSIEEYVWESWSLFRGEPKVDVAARFSPNLAHLVLEERYHPTQRVEVQPDGSVIFRARVAGWQEFGWWLRQFGDEVEALEPPELRAEFVRLGQKFLEIYGED